MLLGQLTAYEFFSTFRENEHFFLATENAVELLENVLKYHNISNIINVIIHTWQHLTNPCHTLGCFHT